MGFIENTLKLVIESHNDQKDKNGDPYVLHIIRVASKFFDEEEVIAALLHDIIEDTDITLNDLKKKGYKRKIIQAVECLTRRKKESYKSYIYRISKNKLAFKIKLADLSDNTDIRRYKKLNSENINRLLKYINAFNILINVHKK